VLYVISLDKHDLIKTMGYTFTKFTFGKIGGLFSEEFIVKTSIFPIGTLFPERISYPNKRPEKQPRISLENSRERHEDMAFDGPELRRKEMQAESAGLKDSVPLRSGLLKILDMLQH